MQNLQYLHMRFTFYFFLLFCLFVSYNALSETNEEKKQKLKKNLESVERLYQNDVLDEESYQKSKTKIAKRKQLCY